MTQERRGAAIAIADLRKEYGEPLEFHCKRDLVHCGHCQVPPGPKRDSYCYPPGCKS